MDIGRQIGAELTFEERFLGTIATTYVDAGQGGQAAMYVAAAMVEACARHPEWMMGVAAELRRVMPPDAHEEIAEAAEQIVRFAFVAFEDASSE